MRVTDEELFAAVYEQYGAALYRFCLLQMKNTADAEDILQDVFCKRLYQAPAFDSPAHERNWLFRVALNLCRDEWRHKRRSDLPLDAAADTAAPDAFAGQPLLAAASRLPETQRTALHLYYYEGYDVKEIARLLGVTPSAVKIRIKRGRDALRKEWGENV